MICGMASPMVGVSSSLSSSASPLSSRMGVIWPLTCVFRDLGQKSPLNIPSPAQKCMYQWIYFSKYFSFDVLDRNHRNKNLEHHWKIIMKYFIRRSVVPMVTMSQSVANWPKTHTHMNRTHSLTHLHQHSYNHFVRFRSASSAITDFGKDGTIGRMRTPWWISPQENMCDTHSSSSSALSLL